MGINGSIKRWVLGGATVYALALFVLFAPRASKAQLPELINHPEFRTVARQAVDSLYNMNPEASQRLLEPWKRRYPDHSLWILFDGMELWWQILSDLEDTSHDDRFFDMMARANYESSRLLRRTSDHADGLIVKTISNGYIARQHANRGDWITSLNQARRAYSSYQYLLEVQPELPDLKLAEGLKLYYSAYLPEAYPVVKTVSWILPGGDKEEGLEMLRQAADSSIFARAEARYFLGNINLLYEEEYGRAAVHMERLYNEYPQNGYYVRVLVRSYFEMKAYDRALEVIENSLDRWREQELPYQDVLKEELLTWKGRILFEQGDFRRAYRSFEEAWPLGKKLPATRRREQHARSGYYAGLIAYRMGNVEAAGRYLRAVRELKGTSYSDKAGTLLREMESR